VTAMNNEPTIEAYFNQIYDETFDAIARFVAVKCADVAQVPDIVQETYTDFYQFLLKNGVAGVEHPRGLLFTIAKRKLFRYYAWKDKVKNVVSLQQEDVDAWFSLLDTRVTATEEVDPVMRLEYERILDILADYPADVRKIFYLFYYEDMSHSEIADVMGYTVSNVKNKLYRTLHEIREKEQEQNE
jgi:RNA polymerase sigma-70 factor (ECF subfamily)